MIDLLLIALVASSTTGVERWLDEVTAGHQALPSLAAVQDAAVRALALTDDAEAATWSMRARRRGWVPRIDVRFGTDRDLDVRDSLETSSWIREGSGFGVDVSARWLLGELVFADAELRTNRERIARSAAIRLARERATKIYFDRVAVLLESRDAQSLELLLEAARLDGLLRAATGGLLSEHARRGAEEVKRDPEVSETEEAMTSKRARKDAEGVDE